MSLKVASSIPIPSTFIPAVLRETERAAPQQGRLVQSKDLNSMESEIISKLNNIGEFLKDLEGNFAKVRQELIRKNTIEGRENGKICAVNGKIISNKKKYYKSLEEDVDSLSKTFQDQFKKITVEFNSLQALSKGKNSVSVGSSSDNLTLSDNDQIETSSARNTVASDKSYSRIPNVMKLSKFTEVKTSPSNKEALPQPFKLRTSPEQEAFEPRKVSFGKISQLNTRNVSQPISLPKTNNTSPNSHKSEDANESINYKNINHELMLSNKNSSTSTQAGNKINEAQRYYSDNHAMLYEISLSDSSQDDSFGDALSFHSIQQEKSYGKINFDNIYEGQSEIKF